MLKDSLQDSVINLKHLLLVHTKILRLSILCYIVLKKLAKIFWRYIFFQIRSVVIEHNGKEAMEKEAEKSAESLATGAKILSHNKHQLHALMKEQAQKRRVSEKRGL